MSLRIRESGRSYDSVEECLRRADEYARRKNRKDIIEGIIVHGSNLVLNPPDELRELFITRHAYLKKLTNRELLAVTIRELANGLRGRIIPFCDEMQSEVLFESFMIEHQIGRHPEYSVELSINMLHPTATAFTHLRMPPIDLITPHIPALIESGALFVYTSTELESLPMTQRRFDVITTYD